MMNVWKREVRKETNSGIERRGASKIPGVDDLLKVDTHLSLMVQWVQFSDGIYILLKFCELHPTPCFLIAQIMGLASASIPISFIEHLATITLFIEFSLTTDHWSSTTSLIHPSCIPAETLLPHFTTTLAPISRAPDHHLSTDSHSSRCPSQSSPARFATTMIPTPLKILPSRIKPYKDRYPFIAAIRSSPLPGYSKAKLAIKARGIGVKTARVTVFLAFTLVSNQKGTWYKYSQVYTFLYLPRFYKLIVAYPYLCYHSILTRGYVIICLINLC